MKNTKRLMENLRDEVISVSDKIVADLTQDERIRLANDCQHAGLHEICLSILKDDESQLAAVQFLKGDAYYDLDQFDNSIDVYTKLIEVNSNSVAFNNRGQAYLAKGMDSHALADFLNAIQLDGTNIVAMKAAGTLSLKLNDAQGAVSYFERALSIAPNDVDLMIQLSIAKYHGGHWADSYQVLLDAIDRFPNEPRIEHLLKLIEKEFNIQ